MHKGYDKHVQPNMSSQQNGNVIYVATDPAQEKDGIYKVSKSTNMVTTLAQLNTARAAKDFKVIKTYPVSDLKKATDFITSALKNKCLPGSTEWVKLPDEAGLTKMLTTISTLCDIVNGSD